MARDYGALYPVARAVLTPLFKASWRVHTEGLDRVPEDGGAIVCPNHVSVLDSFFVPLVLPRRITYVGKAEYLDDWKTRYLFPAIGMIPIDRSGGDAAKAALDAAGLEHPKNAVARFLDIYDGRLTNHTRVYDGILDTLNAARSRASLAVLTNKPLAPTTKLLDAFDIRGLFQSVVGGDGPYPRKPDPEGLLAIMATVGVPPSRTLMVGDSAVDYETALRASARACIVSYGFGFRSFARDQIQGSHSVVDDVQGLRGVIERFLRE